jgi:SAM-dependent methyltransferase
MTDSLRLAYDQTPYDSRPITASHIDNLATIARFYGLSSARPDRCRVLELGCASGGNLLPMALAYPDSEFVGIDLSPAQIAEGQRLVSECGVTNLRLEALSITDLDLTGDKFDYIVCHGVYSWVPPEVQDASLRACSALLAPDGIAYVSYNTYPGWHARMLVRDMMLAQDDRTLPPMERVARARAYVARIVEKMGDRSSTHAAALREEAKVIAHQPDAQVLHEQLEPFNEPLLVTEFARRAALHGLQHVADARIEDVVRMATVARPRTQAERIRAEQDDDFATGRTFRRSVLCHAARTIADPPRVDAVRELEIGSRAEAAAPSAEDAARGPFVRAFRVPEGVTVTSDDPLLAACMDTLFTVAPASMPFARLAGEVRERLAAMPLPESAVEATERLPSLVLRVAAAGLLTLRTLPHGFAPRVSDRPVASRLARWQARRGPSVSTMYHLTMQVLPLEQFLLPFLDGARDRSGLAEELARALDDGRMKVETRPNPEQMQGLVAGALERLCAFGLLVG